MISVSSGLVQLLSKATLAILQASLKFSPLPMALALRREFAEHGRALSVSLMERAPAGIFAVIDERYGSDRDTLLDVYTPEQSVLQGEKLATIVWTHGGAWLGGSKDEIGGYLRIIAAAGFTVVGVRYSLAPERTYPTPVRQVTAALRHLQDNADRLHVDPARLILAGDSAGAHISAQIAAIATNPTYARQVGIEPAFAPEQLRALALCCGIYDVATLGDAPSFRDFVAMVGWAYSGIRDYVNDHHFASTASVINHINGAFPATFVTAGDDDPLEGQSKALAAVLEANGVSVDTLFYSKGHEPPLPHEYQFDLDLADGRTALQRLIDFFKRCTDRT